MMSISVVDRNSSHLLRHPLSAGSKKYVVEVLYISQSDSFVFVWWSGVRNYPIDTGKKTGGDIFVKMLVSL